MSENELPVPEKQTMKWSMSASIGKLVEALSKAQLRFDPVLKDNDNPAFRSKYADLATVIESTRKHLASEGVSVIQMPHAEFGEGDAKILTLTTMLAHSSGEWISTDLSLPAMMRERFDAQSVGSAITYARRYALAAMTCVAQEDDDGNKAAGVGTKEAAQNVATKKLKEFAAAGNKTAIDALSQMEPSTKITIKRPESFNGHYISASGNIEAEPLVKFFTDTESQKFQPKSGGLPYRRVPAEYEKSLIELCNKLEIEIEG
jgi:hypothetical protein